MKHKFLAVVDDCSMLVEALRIVLSEAGYASQGFEHGRDFLDHFHPATSGLILGINMPVMNGYETLEEMKSRGIVMPVLTMSAYTPLPQILELLQGGSDFHLWKPFRLSLFLEAVNRVMETTERPIGCGWTWDEGYDYTKCRLAALECQQGTRSA